MMADPVALRQGDLREHNLVLLLRHREPRRHCAVPGRAGRPDRADPGHRLDAGRRDAAGRPASTEVAPAPASRCRPSVDGPGPEPAGRRPDSGLEVNVDYLAACVVDLSGAVRHHAVVARRPTPAIRPPMPSATLADLARDAAAVAAAAGPAPSPAPRSAVPGLVHAGQIRLAPNLGWHDVTIPEPRWPASRWPSTTKRTWPRSARWRPTRPHRASFVYISGEIGIGAGIVVNGQVVRGARGFAGEIGHLAVHPDGPTLPLRCARLPGAVRRPGRHPYRSRPEPAGGRPVSGLRRARRVRQPADGDGTRPGRRGARRRHLRHGEPAGRGHRGARRLLRTAAAVAATGGGAGDSGTRTGGSLDAGVDVVASTLGSDAAVRGAAHAALASVLGNPAGWIAARHIAA